MSYPGRRFIDQTYRGIWTFDRLRSGSTAIRAFEESDWEFQEMPLPREDVDATTPKFLRDKYAVVGVPRAAVVTMMALALSVSTQQLGGLADP
jgi:hypothetical protein